jgi:predicted dehydrogenase
MKGVRKMKVGIVGAGGMGRAHATQLLQIEGVEVTAVCDTNEERARALASEISARAFVDHRKLIETDVDAVWVCTPDFAHKDIVVDAAVAKKHIFCEKPIALTLEDAEEMVEAVERAGVINMIGYVLRFYPTFSEVKRRFDSGELGELVTAWIRRFMPWTPRDWYGDPSLSGGIAVDFSTHDVDWLMWIGGYVERVYAHTATVGTKVENDVWAILKFKKGGSGVLGDSFVASIGGSCFGVIGTEGTAMVEGSDTVLVKLRSESEPKRVTPVSENPVKLEDAYFIERVRNGEKATPDLRWGMEVLKVTLAIRESASCGEVVRL